MPKKKVNAIDSKTAARRRLLIKGFDRSVT
jgi:hypothetical protein